MKFLVITFKGLESFLKQELMGIKFISFDNFFICETENKEKLIHLRSATRVIKIVNQATNFNTLMDYQLTEEEKKATTFSCKIISEIDKEDLKEDFIQSRKIKLRYSHPDIIYYLINTHNHLFLGVDVSGDLTKRDYRIFTTRYSLNSVVAYALSQFGYSENTAFITTTDGSPAIEFALTHNENITVFCLEKSLFNGIRKNVILSGVKDKIELKENLDLKQSKFERLVIPLNFKITKAGVTVKTLLTMVKGSVKKDLITLAFPSAKETLKELLKEFKIKKEIPIFQGKLELILLWFERK